MSRPPSPWSRKCLAASRAQVNVPRRCTWTTASKSSSRHLPQHPVAQDAGVGDHDVEPAERLDARARTSRSAASVVPTGTDLGDGRAAGGGDRVDDGAGRLGVHVVDDDRGAGLGEGRGVGAAEALPGAGDDGDLAGDVHVLCSWWWCVVWAVSRR